MDQPICKLTLVYPPSVAESLIELVMSIGPALGGFTTFAAEGHGFDFSKASIRERVRGRVERCVLVAVMPRERASQVLEAIRIKLPVPHMTYWLEPVIEVGRLLEAIPDDVLSDAQSDGLGRLKANETVPTPNA